MVIMVPSPNIVVVPSTDPAFGNCSVGVGEGRDVPVGGVGVFPHKQFAFPGHTALLHKLDEQIMPDAQSLLDTHPLLHPFGGVGDGVGHKQLVAPVHSGLRQNPV